MTEKLWVSFKRRHPDAVIPKYMTTGSAACDVCSAEDVVLMPKTRTLVNLGFSLEFSSNYECQARPRSGMALKHGITIFNSPGTIDSDYRGVMGIVLYNTTDYPFEIKKGERVAQFVFAPIVQAEFVEVDELSESSRGEGGYGSTGSK